MAKLNDQISDKVLKNRRTRLPCNAAQLFEMLDLGQELSAEAERLLQVDDEYSLSAAIHLYGVRDILQSMSVLLSHGLPISAVQLAGSLLTAVRAACFELGAGDMPELLSGGALPDTPRDADYEERLRQVGKILEGGNAPTEEEAEIVRSFISDYGIGDEEVGADDDDEEDEFEDDFEEDDESYLLPGNFSRLLDLYESQAFNYSQRLSASGLGTLSETNFYDAVSMGELLSIDELCQHFSSTSCELVRLLVLPLAILCARDNLSQDEKRRGGLLQLAFSNPVAVSVLRANADGAINGEFRDVFVSAGLLSGDNDADLAFLKQALAVEPLLRWIYDEDIASNLERRIAESDSESQQFLSEIGEALSARQGD